MGIAMGGTDFLSEKAALMRESLQKSQTITDNVVTILGSFDHRLSALETAMRPTQVNFIFIFFLVSKLDF
jgi:exocyst complex protein 7